MWTAVPWRGPATAGAFPGRGRQGLTAPPLSELFLIPQLALGVLTATLSKHRKVGGGQASLFLCGVD